MCGKLLLRLPSPSLVLNCGADLRRWLGASSGRVISATLSHSQMGSTASRTVSAKSAVPRRLSVFNKHYRTSAVTIAMATSASRDIDTDIDSIPISSAIA
jgi:hypothetical protein